jgi:hypothetical protein
MSVPRPTRRPRRVMLVDSADEEVALGAGGVASAVEVTEFPAGSLAGGPAQEFDYDTGGGDEPTSTVGIVIPASGGPEAAGHAANPLHVTDADVAAGAASVASIDTKTPALGQALAAASVPVVLTAAQLTTLTPPAAIAGFATSAKQDTEIAGLVSIDAGVAAAAASLSVVDDWDESDRAKVNLIAGQAGITAGAGNVAASTPRVTLAADDPAVAGIGTLKSAHSVAAIQATASGDTSLIASGTRKLKRVEASNSHGSTALTVGLKIASLNGGATFGKKYLPAAGGLAVWNFPGGFLQVTAEVVNVNLSALGQVEVTAYYE